MEFWVVFGLVGVVAMIPVRAGVPATERSHLFEYGLLAVMIYEALTERRSCGAGVRFPALTAICTASIVGWLDEAVQAFVPGRVYDLRDVGTNALAAVVVVTAVAALRAMRERS